MSTCCGISHQTILHPCVALLEEIKHILYCDGLSRHLPVQIWPFSLHFIQLKSPNFFCQFFLSSAQYIFLKSFAVYPPSNWSAFHTWKRNFLWWSKFWFFTIVTIRFWFTSRDLSKKVWCLLDGTKNSIF